MSQQHLEKLVESTPSPGEKFFPKFERSAELDAAADLHIADHPENSRSVVLPLLHLVQQRFGYISAQAIEWVAERLDISAVQVLEVVTFYPGFRQSAPGKFHIRVCRTLSCAMGGSYELMDELCKLTGIKRSDSHSEPISVSEDGVFSLEFAECLASCGTAPVCLVNDDFHENVTVERAQDLLNSYQNQLDKADT